LSMYSGLDATSKWFKIQDAHHSMIKSRLFGASHKTWDFFTAA